MRTFSSLPAPIIPSGNTLKINIAVSNDYFNHAVLPPLAGQAI